MISVHSKKTVDACLEQVFTKFTDHENLDQLFNAKFKVIRLADCDQPLGGKGCIRQVSIAGVSFQEQIIRADHNAIHYKVLNDFPVKQHLGKISFVAKGQQTEVSYSIECLAPWFLPRFILQKILAKDIQNCLTKLGEKYDPS
jgi:uncharacterized membrane protein